MVPRGTFRRIAEVLREQIQDGTLPCGSTIPSEFAWVFVGGKVKSDETPEQAAVREAAEEAGATVVGLGEIGRRVHPRTGRLMVYIDCRAVDDDVRVAAPDELAEVCWVSAPALDELMPDLFGPVRAHLRVGWAG